ncbi:hypothetical protein BH10ACT10_BH10ACT10_14190 [soil metagenome]
MSQAAHFLSRSKKDIVDAAVREYIDAHRNDINAGIKAALGQLNGTDVAAVSLMTGLSSQEIDDLGGLKRPSHGVLADAPFRSEMWGCGRSG